MIISFSGKIGSGKDLSGNICKILLESPHLNNEGVETFLDKELYKNEGSWEIRKWADKLKEIVCTILNCSMEQLEDRVFKETKLGEEWDKFKVVRTKITKFERIDEVFYFSTIEEANKFKLNNLNYDYFGEIEKVEMTPRLMLQLLGTECGRNIIHPDIWVNSLMADYKKIEDKESRKLTKIYAYPNWIITDTRFENELEAVKKREGITIRVNRSKSRKVFLMNAHETINTFYKEHPSETALDNSTFDYEIINDGTISELIDKMRNILIENKLIKNN